MIYNIILTKIHLMQYHKKVRIFLWDNIDLLLSALKNLSNTILFSLHHFYTNVVSILIPHKIKFDKIIMWKLNCMTYLEHIYEISTFTTIE
jgi:hypothetical protein